MKIDDYKFYLINKRYYLASDLDIPILCILLKRDANIKVNDIQLIDFDTYISCICSNTFKNTIYSYRNNVLIGKVCNDENKKENRNE